MSAAKVVKRCFVCSWDNSKGSPRWRVGHTGTWVSRVIWTCGAGTLSWLSCRPCTREILVCYLMPRSHWSSFPLTKCSMKPAFHCSWLQWQEIREEFAVLGLNMFFSLSLCLFFPVSSSVSLAWEGRGLWGRPEHWRSGKVFSITLMTALCQTGSKQQGHFLRLCLGK